MHETSTSTHLSIHVKSLIFYEKIFEKIRKTIFLLLLKITFIPKVKLFPQNLYLQRLHPPICPSIILWRFTNLNCFTPLSTKNSKKSIFWNPQNMWLMGFTVTRQPNTEETMEIYSTRDRGQIWPKERQYVFTVTCPTVIRRGNVTCPSAIKGGW